MDTELLLILQLLPEQGYSGYFYSETNPWKAKDAWMEDRLHERLSYKVR